MQSGTGVVVVALYGEAPHGLWERLAAFVQAGLQVVVVNNNNALPPNHQTLPPVTWLNNGNRGGLAGGLNRGVSEALALNGEYITLLDQDSELDAKAVIALQQEVGRQPDQIVGPAIWDQERAHWHTRHRRPRLLITSGTTFHAAIWQLVGPYQEWMEIDYIDHEWCSRARRKGLQLRVLPHATLKQHFGERHSNPLAHLLGLQQYSPYRRAIALRNLRWLLHQNYVPLDIRLKEGIKMLFKPWCWLILEPHRRRNARCLWIGLTAPLGQPFPQTPLL